MDAVQHQVPAAYECMCSLSPPYGDLFMHGEWYALATGAWPALSPSRAGPSIKAKLEYTLNRSIGTGYRYIIQP